MKFIVSSSYLLKQLQVLTLSTAVILPILDNFFFDLDHNVLTVSSDLETTMSQR
jgi:DNA polymerase-3 subunit beta